MNLSDKRIVRSEDVAWRIIEDQALVVSAMDNCIYPLNEVGSRVWELLDGKTGCGDIIKTVDAEFEGEKGTLQNDVLCFLKDMLDKGLCRICE